MLTRKRAAEANQPPQPTATTLDDVPATSKKKAKIASARYLCTTCDTEKTARLFPDYNPSADCHHLINTCKSCLKEWLRVCIESAEFVKGPDGDSFGVKCPECPATMRPVNVQAAVAKTVFAKFDEAHRHFIGEATPGWRWCLAPGCNAGQVHEKQAVAATSQKRKTTGKKNAKEPEKNQPDICTCQKCGAQACVSCDRPYHNGEDCQAYQRRTKGRMDEEEKSLKEVSRISKNCPGCGKRIQKDGGCPIMYCTQCHKTFCWTCQEVVIRGYCRCHPEPRTVAA
ncbi:hypothetical protein AC578_109 [Pseudocercospora eumusae]|uniref:RBR-type E3 ubiquitin transferase n=1 Tax=Pseudocercospora eumusae TaxID=321146 RepID=A0A139HP21_9PEZI|nr:hypothetical protein AC578_109 [Pseudocercospora eumusae]